MAARLYVSHHKLGCANHVPPYAWRKCRRRGLYRRIYSSFVQQLVLSPRCNSCKKVHASNGDITTIKQQTTRKQRSLILCKEFVHLTPSVRVRPPASVGASQTLLLHIQRRKHFQTFLQYFGFSKLFFLFFAFFCLRAALIDSN